RMHLARAIRKSQAIDDDRWRRTGSPHRSETGTFVEKKCLAGGTAAEGIPIQLVSQLITMIPSSGCLTWRRLVARFQRINCCDRIAVRRRAALYRRCRYTRHLGSKLVSIQ